MSKSPVVVLVCAVVLSCSGSHPPTEETLKARSSPLNNVVTSVAGIGRKAPNGPPSSSPYALAKLGNQILFSATTPQEGIELWKSDGTAAGTQLDEAWIVPSQRGVWTHGEAADSQNVAPRGISCNPSRLGPPCSPDS